ncbi:unnamed protein product [Blepharisma stoltei]|uniref:Uncharacterized protein n=1 Tax=Blepharisma stoltei TaxID=1481888 RepID=A0AAU9K9J7_9CILI|nr:unnamed protein product [Blepharisma stoltei]
MEYLLIGGLISIPLIYYSTRPVPIEPTLEKPEDSPKEEPVQEKFYTQEELDAMKQRSKERQERILSAMTPHEQEIFKSYIKDLQDKEKNHESGFHKGVDWCMFVVLCLVITGIIYAISQHAAKLPISSDVDL